MQHRFQITLFSLFAACILVACSGDLPLVSLTGSALFPPGLADAVGPVANSAYDVIDLEKPEDDNVVAMGMTDEKGDFEVKIPQTSVAAIVIALEVRVSGLIVADGTAPPKALDGVTDIACEAGISAVLDGSITAAELTQDRIDNLEAAVQQVAQIAPIDFADPSAVSAAAMQVRTLTSDGATSPVE